MRAQNRLFAILLAAVIMAALVLLSACGSETEVSQSRAAASSTSAAVPQSGAAAESTAVPAQQSEAVNADTSVSETSDSTGSKILIAYFSVPEDVDTSRVDAVAGASIVVKDREVLGNTEYVAQIIQNTIGGDLFRIETTDAYPLDHEPLVNQAADEQDENVRPTLKTHIENPSQYDTVILGFPNWWGDMPQPLYTFLEEYDFSGKTIIPFVTHGGSGFSGTRATIAELQPGAAVSDDTLSLSRNDVAGAEDEIRQWAEGLMAG